MPARRSAQNSASAEDSVRQRIRRPWSNSKAAVVASNEAGAGAEVVAGAAAKAAVAANASAAACSSVAARRAAAQRTVGRRTGQSRDG